MSVQHEKQLACMRESTVCLTVEFLVRLHLIKRFWVFKTASKQNIKTPLRSIIWLNTWKHTTLYLLIHYWSLFKNILIINVVFVCRQPLVSTFVDTTGIQRWSIMTAVLLGWGKKIINCACALHMWVTRNRITHISSFRRDVINNVSFSWRRSFVCCVNYVKTRL